MNGVCVGEPNIGGGHPPSPGSYTYGHICPTLPYEGGGYSVVAICLQLFYCPTSLSSPGGHAVSKG